MAGRVAAWAGFVLGAVIGFQSVEPLAALFLPGGWPRLGAQFAAAAVVAVAGRLSAPLLWALFVRGMSRVLAWLGRVPLRDLGVALVGLAVGLLIASAVGYLLSGIPGIGGYLRLGALVVFGYLGLQFALQRREELAGMFDRSGRRVRGAPKVLDTSAIIDGRIADVVQAGFLEGTLLVPRSVLRELQSISDSTDPRRRARGRRALDVLNRLQTESQALQIVEDEGGGDVDERVVELARAHRASIVTTDFNLNRVAQLQGVRVLNINDLSGALRPVVLPGEELRVQVMREGKEAGQGVGYLEDGTMIVVEGGRGMIGTEVEVVATSVLQTAAGRMIFARPKHDGAGRRSTG
ncbi:MAG: TRAM domain-containing protein [Armatimonadota bacterium]|nr:TRAM domain-containing protein [Armatimonadota bacterium]MDR5696698.1 TRAM domain-containing protein [Armatimonadota bacterium]